MKNTILGDISNPKTSPWDGVLPERSGHPGWGATVEPPVLPQNPSTRLQMKNTILGDIPNPHGSPWDGFGGVLPERSGHPEWGATVEPQVSSSKPICTPPDEEYYLRRYP
jgi:hypothetical protein